MWATTFTTPLNLQIESWSSWACVVQMWQRLRAEYILGKACVEPHSFYRPVTSDKNQSQFQWTADCLNTSTHCDYQPEDASSDVIQINERAQYGLTMMYSGYVKGERFTFINKWTGKREQASLACISMMLFVIGRDGNYWPHLLTCMSTICI